MNLTKIAVRFSGNQFDGRTYEVEAVADDCGAIPPGFVWMPVADDAGRIKTLGYKLARHDTDGMLLYEFDHERELARPATDSDEPVKTCSGHIIVSHLMMGDIDVYCGLDAGHDGQCRATPVLAWD